MELYATIRKQSQYWHQQPTDDKRRPIPFAVSLRFEHDPFWPVRGGVGGRYAIYDVELWIHRDGKLVKLPIHSIE